MSNLDIEPQIDSAVGNNDYWRREEEKRQGWEEERMKKALDRSEKKKRRNGKKKYGSHKRAEEKWFPKVPPKVDSPEIKAQIDQISRLPVGQGFLRRGNDGNYIYVRRTMGPGCYWTGETPPEGVGCSVTHGTNFLSKTINITPDGSDSGLDRYCTDETKILVKGKYSVCVVARGNSRLQAAFLGSIAFGSAASFCLGKNHGYPPDSDDHEEMMRPFSRVTFSVDTVKEGCKETPSQYMESEDYYEPLCEKDLAGHFNEQKAVNYLENKMKQDPVIGHDETIQTAITAFKYLLQEDFKSDEITVWVVGKEFWIDRALSVEEIEEQLAHIVN